VRSAEGTGGSKRLGPLRGKAGVLTVYHPYSQREERLIGEEKNQLFAGLKVSLCLGRRDNSQTPAKLLGVKLPRYYETMSLLGAISPSFVPSGPVEVKGPR